MRSADPVAMSPGERIAELGELLGGGIQRLLARESKAIRDLEVVEDHLAVVGQVEAPCGPNSTEVM